MHRIIAMLTKGSYRRKKKIPKQLPETPHILCNNNKSRKKVLTNVCKNFSILLQTKRPAKLNIWFRSSCTERTHYVHNDDKVSP